MSQIMSVSPVVAKELLCDVLDAGLVSLLVSSPGIGKSSIIKQVAKERNLFMIDLRLAASDPTDLAGFPSLNADKTKAGYLPMDTFPTELDKIPEGYSGWLLFLDEMTSAPMSVQAAAYKLVLDRQVGLLNLHKDVHIIAAGNKATDKAIVTRTSTAMQSRLVTMELGLDVKAWISYALQNDFDHRIISYITQFSDKLHMFDPNHNDVTFPCPRTYEFLSKIIKPMKDIPEYKLPLIQGTVGTGVALEFMQFVNLFGMLPTIEEIMANPETAKCYPADGNLSYAITGLLVSNMTAANADKIIPYIERMNIEFQIIVFRQAFVKDPAIQSNKSFNKWLSANASLMRD